MTVRKIDNKMCNDNKNLSIINSKMGFVYEKHWVNYFNICLITTTISN
jgi:hypothetical protein